MVEANAGRVPQSSAVGSRLGKAVEQRLLQIRRPVLEVEMDPEEKPGILAQC